MIIYLCFQYFMMMEHLGWKNIYKDYSGVVILLLSHFSHIWVFATLWTVARQPPLSMGFSRQKHLSGLPFPPPGGLPDPGIKPVPLTSTALANGFFFTSATWEVQGNNSKTKKVEKCLFRKSTKQEIKVWFSVFPDF